MGYTAAQMAEIRQFYEGQFKTEIRSALVNHPLWKWGIRRIYFVSSSAGKGKKRKRWVEVEMIQLPNGRCHVIKDYPTNGLDNLAEEIFSVDMIPPNLTPYQYFLDRFHELPANVQFI